MVDNIGSWVDSRGRGWNWGGARWRGTGRQHHLVIIIIFFVVTIVRIIIIIIIFKRGACRQHHLILEGHHQVKFLVIEEKKYIKT